MENFIAFGGIIIFISSCIRIFKFIRHKIWLYIPLFLLGGIAISVGFILIFEVYPRWAGEMAWPFTAGVAVLYETYLKKKHKKKKEPRFKINKHKRLLTIFGVLIIISIMSTLLLIYGPTNPEYVGKYSWVDEPIESGEYVSVGLEKSQIPYQVEIEVLSSGINLDVYILPKEPDFEVFKRNPRFNVYENCYRELIGKSSFSCNVTGGGIVILNPTKFNGFFSLDARDNGYVESQNQIITIEAYESLK